MWVSLTDEQRLVILKAYGIEYDRLVREKERYEITSVSRTQAWKLEREGKFPPRKSTGKKSCGWLFSDLLWWIQTR
ncbi:helix-turn-helix transcriptional regulator [Escherichia coli]|uniref:helix-turn-helix transcriptional regulator n=1 Tax=Escherichia coli TaxID=562 RepID=UPI000BEAA42B|nr:AlpA family phage regulatory protein [Escherichia coli]